MAHIFDEESWRRFMDGFTIHDCAIFREKGFGFVLFEQQENSGLPALTSFITMALDKPIENRFGVFQVGGFDFTSLACGTNPAEYVAVDTYTQVYSASGSRKGIEKNIDQVLDMSTAMGKVGIVQKVVRVAGQVYALGDYRKIYRRIGVEQWVELGAEGKGAPMPKDSHRRDYTAYDIGFNDLAAFSADDMYGVGGQGDVWRWDGKKWHQCPFPTNALLEAVACGEDGKVYVVESKGSVWAGRENKWEKIAEADCNPGFNPQDAVWFKGRLYLGAQDGVFVLGENKDLVPVADVDENAPLLGNLGRLDISPDGNFMLTAGSHGASLFDGTTWTKLFSTFDFLE